MRFTICHCALSRWALACVAAVLLCAVPAQSPSMVQDVRSEGVTAGAAGPIGTVDLSGAWLMKDFAIGIGMSRHVTMPGNIPKDCLPYRVPGTVRTALLALGEIPDPYFGYDNEKSLWVEEKEWWFFKTFSPGEHLKGKWVDLVFEGASFQGEVWLNGHHVGDLKGMLNPRSFDVTAWMKFGQENTIAVRLEATPDARQNEITRGLTWDSPRDQLFSIAQCMYGWDWGPHGVPIGLWRPVKLRVSGPLRIDHPYVRSQIASAALAECTVECEVRNLPDVQRDGTINGVILEKNTGKEVATFRQSVTLAPGQTRTISFGVSVRDPKLWWPNGMGDQHLYVMRVGLSEGTTVSEQLTTQFGIRELKLIENEHVEEYLKSVETHVGSQYDLGKAVGSYPWTFQVNGKKMFAKGGNWIPVDQLLRLGRDRYDRILTLAKEAHFNLLRVWGGGLYETDDFYELCDEYGILAWQEFLSNKPFSKIDRGNFLEGASSAVLRIRNHPSLTFWCGGNEFDPDDSGSKTVVDALESMLGKLDPQREFHRASPYKGDDHHWGVWHGQQPYTAYRVVRPFRSESGLNAFPVEENYLKFTPQSLLWPPDTTFIEYHGEYNTRFQHLGKLSRYANEFGVSTSIGELIRKNELYQALANAFNMEFCRANKYRMSGLLIWQFNDIWPCLSWSMVDWYGTPKPSYYYQKRASRPIHVSVDFERYIWKAGETFSANVFLLNDVDAPVKGATYAVKVFDTQGNTLVANSGPAETAANTSAKIGRIEYRIPSAMAGKTIFVSVELMGKDGRRISSALYPIAVSSTASVEHYENAFAQMNHLPQADINVEFIGPEMNVTGTRTHTGMVRLSNPTDKLAFFVRLRLVEESETLRTTYSDNYLALLPGETTTVAVRVENTSAGSAPGMVQCEVSGWNCRTRLLDLPLAKQK